MSDERAKKIIKRCIAELKKKKKSTQKLEKMSHYNAGMVRYQTAIGVLEMILKELEKDV